MICPQIEQAQQTAESIESDVAPISAGIFRLFSRPLYLSAVTQVPSFCWVEATSTFEQINDFRKRHPQNVLVGVALAAALPSLVCKQNQFSHFIKGLVTETFLTQSGVLLRLETLLFLCLQPAQPCTRQTEIWARPSFQMLKISSAWTNQNSHSVF